MIKISTLIKTLVLSVVSIASANATTVYEGNLIGNTVSIGQTFPQGAQISDHYLFDILPTGSYASILTTISLAPYFAIDGLSISLSGNGMTPITQTLGVGQTALSLGPVNLAAGSGYDFHVSGTATGVAGGAYAGLIAAQPFPVPLPAAALLLGSGLIGLAGIGKRT